MLEVGINTVLSSCCSKLSFLLFLYAKGGQISSSLREKSSAYEPGPQMLPQQAPRLPSLPPLRIVFWIFFPIMQEKPCIFNTETLSSG